MGISPGNLYYHYRSKDDIIRALFERLFALWDTALALPADETLTIDSALHVVRVNFEIMWAYRFVFRELPALLRGDAALRERYLVVRRRGYEGFRESLAYFAATGQVNLPDEVTIHQLADLCWLISEHWLSAVEVSGESVTPEQMQRGIELMGLVLRPYLPPPTL